MIQTWSFSDVEFVAAWAGMKEDYLPDPFVYRAHTEYKDDHDRLLIEARDRLRQRLGNELDPMLREIARPDIRIVVRGIDGQDVHNPKGRVRLLGTRLGDRAFLVSQLPGETVWHAGGFTITEHPVVGLAAAIVDALPAVGPGKEADVVLADKQDAEMDFGYGQSAVHDSFEDGVTTRSNWFNSAPATTVGTIEINQAYSRFGPRGIVRSHLHWRDLVDDGRYAVVPGSPATAVAADTKRLVGLINSELVSLVRAIKDERL